MRYNFAHLRERSIGITFLPCRLKCCNRQGSLWRLLRLGSSGLLRSIIVYVPFNNSAVISAAFQRMYIYAFILCQFFCKGRCFYAVVGIGRRLFLWLLCGCSLCRLHGGAL